MADGVAATRPEHRELEELLRGMLAPDGYDLVVHNWPETAGERLRLEIVATPDACADCLVPKEVLRMILVDRLGESSAPASDDDLIYPRDTGAGEHA